MMDMKRRNVDMLEGDLWLNVLLFAIPVMLSGILQLLFNAIDMIVVGKFSGSASMAAVSSTGSSACSGGVVASGFFAAGAGFAVLFTVVCVLGVLTVEAGFAAVFCAA